MRTLFKATGAMRRPSGGALARRRAGSSQQCTAMQVRVSLREAAVKDLQGKLSRLCTAIIESGGSMDELYQARMLACSLLHAKRLLDLAIDAQASHADIPRC